VTVSRAELIRRAAIRLGGRVGNIASGQETAAVLTGLIDNSNDDGMYVQWHLFMLDAATEADRERTVTNWNASSGIASWETVRSDTTYTSETYILVPDYALDEFRRALNLALRQSKRTYRYVLPLVNGIAHYNLDRLTWLEGADDVDAAWIGTSPNMLHNEDFEFWQNGSALAPDGWTLAGTGATVARASTGIRSPYAVTVTRASNDATLYQEVPLPLVQYFTRSSNAPLPSVSFGAWVTSSTASIARVGVYNGTSTEWTSYHTGNGVPQYLTSTYQTTATDTALRLVLGVDTTNGSASFHEAHLTDQSAIPQQLSDRGSKAYVEYEAQAQVRNVGGVPTIELPYPQGNGQLIVYSRRPFPEMSADTDVVEDQYADALQAGMLRYLTDAMKPNQDRARIDQVRREEAPKWARANKKFISKPVSTPPTQVRVGGA
jgi:hypothetical protein